MMDTAYFVAGIALLLVVNIIALCHVNRKSYLQTPMQIRRFKEETPEQAVPAVENEKPMTRAQLSEHKYVDWYTSRSPARHTRKEKLDDKSLPDQDALVGVAIICEEKEPGGAQARPVRNIDRWYREAANG